MLKKIALTSLAAATLGSAGWVHAQQPASPHTISANVGLYSQYIFRGLTQTNADPALQGGFDYEHASGFYAGTWGSNISWLSDDQVYTSSSLELDFYGGYQGDIGKTGFGYDVGLLYYAYPGTVPAGVAKADTLEAYGALTWKWITAKYSQSLGNKTFGVEDSRGTWYLDLSAEIPLTDKLNLTLHWGKQKFKGTSGGVSNNSVASFEDYMIGIDYSLPKDFTVGLFFTGTDMSSAQKAFYTNGENRFLGKDALTVFVQKTF
jgi:uncharacterized protein (TIGR02001 family)